MKILVLSLAVCSLVAGSPLPEADPSPAAYASDYGYYLPAAAAVPASLTSSQYHAQDELGQYNYGYQSADQTKAEVKTADGVVRGAYSYVDANGIVQTVNYISDALGFRVAATNLPIHVVEPQAAVAVAEAAAPAEAAPVADVEAVAKAEAAPAAVLAAQVPYSYLPYALNYAYQLPPTQYAAPAAVPQPIFSLPYAAAQPVVAAAAPASIPAVAAAPAVVPAVQAAVPIAAAPLATQYHSQDEAGQYTFGYADGSSDRQEIKTADGVVRGAYHYVDTNGLIQTVEYIADSEGFRVAGTNLPTHVAAATLDTPEVAAARAQHILLYNQAAAEAALQPEDEEAEASPAVVEAAEPEAYYGAAAQVVPIVNNSIPAVQAYYGAAAPYAAPVVAPVAASYATPVAAPVAASYAAPVVPIPAAVAGTQYHAQDELGQYNYGYSDINSEKQEVKTADGVVRGSYRYVDSDGLIQTVNYIADALGFRVGATNLPVHVVPAADAAAPAVAVEAAAPAVAVEAAAPAVAAAQPVVAAYSSVLAPQVSYAYLPYASGYAYNAQPLPIITAAAAEAQPAAVVPQPAVAAAAVEAAAVAPAAVPVIVAGATTDQNSQFHAQDEFGQYNYGYANPTQTKTEVKTADGIVRGAYSYVDANGIVQTVNYISDAMGFRVAATNLPVHVVEGAETAVADVAPAVEEAKLRTEAVLTPQVSYSYLPYAQSYAYQLPTAISA